MKFISALNIEYSDTLSGKVQFTSRKEINFKEVEHK